MDEPVAGSAQSGSAYRSRLFILVAGLLLLFVMLRSEATSDLAVVDERLSEAQLQTRSARSELSEAERRIAGLESELVAVSSVERDRAEERLAEERAELRDEYEKRIARVDRRDQGLDERARSLAELAEELDSRDAQIAEREAELDDQSGTAVLSGGNDDSAESDCHPSYEGPCVPIVSDVDCAGGSGDGPEYVGRVTVVGPDEYDLDRDGDGIGCD